MRHPGKLTLSGPAPIGRILNPGRSPRTTRRTMGRPILAWATLGGLLMGTLGGSPMRAAEPGPPLVFQDGFEEGAGRWEPTDPSAWKVTKVDDGHVYDQHKKRSNYNPPHRSPYNISLIKDLYVGDFVLQTRVRSTHPDYGHRDVCLFFGYQDPAHFYYVHLGKKTDAHANQIFIVDDKPRTKISTKTTPGTDWDDAWHDVKIERDTSTGMIRVYFDDMENPVMEARDTTFTWGRLGVGSFDDTSQWDEVRVYGQKVDKKG